MSAQPQRALVTGGAGFIGSHLVEALQRRGATVRTLDVRRPVAGQAQADWCPVDLLDRTALTEAVRQFKPTVIFNLAAGTDISRGREAFRVNTEGLKHLIDAADALGTPPRLVHASTQLVVGPGYVSKGPRDYAPYTEYGESKAESEELLWREGSSDWTIIRPTTVWGAWHATFANSIWKYLGRRWYMLPTGVDPVRSYGYVGNVVYQMVQAAVLPSSLVSRRVFYVGDQPVRSSVWLDGFSRALTGKPVRRVPGALLKMAAHMGELSGRLGGPSPINLGRLYRMSTDYPVPMEDSFTVLGRGPASFAEGIAATVEWLRSCERR